MIKEYHIRFEELAIDRKRIGAVLGYGNDPMPAPFDSYVEEALKDARSLPDIRFCYRIIDEVVVGGEQGDRILAGGEEFKVGKTLIKELKGSKRIALFICTAGKTISEKSGNLLRGEDPVLGYIYDVLGSLIAESAGDRMQSVVKQEIGNAGERITNRFSPGYCQWHVSDQHKLFSFFCKNICGVSLTESALMHPVKSISGIIGIGKDIKFREYGCTLCSGKGCIYRRIKKGKQVYQT